VGVQDMLVMVEDMLVMVEDMMIDHTVVDLDTQVDL
jgi:hypothetical protein